VRVPTKSSEHASVHNMLYLLAEVFVGQDPSSAPGTELSLTLIPIAQYTRSPQVSVVLSKKNPISLILLPNDCAILPIISRLSPSSHPGISTPPIPFQPSSTPHPPTPPFPRQLFTTRTQRAVELKNIRSMEQENKDRNHDNTH